jgi:hypothetical protein
MRAVVVKIDGEPVGVVGLAREFGITRFFSEYKPDIEPYLSHVTSWRAVATVLGWIKASEVPIYSVAEHDEGARLLGRLGFTHLIEDIWLF